MRADGRSSGGALTLPLRFTVRKGTLDPVDIPAGPLEPHHRPALVRGRGRRLEPRHGGQVAAASCASTASPPRAACRSLTYRGFKDGEPQLDFARGDAQMKLFKEHGFRMPVVTYCPFHGLNTYYKDEAAMQAAGFTDYSAFLKAVFAAVQKHADEAGWLPVYWNIGDEPIGDDLVRSAENAEAYRKAFPKGPPFFTARQLVPGHRTRTTRTSGCRRRCTSSTGTCTTRRR